ncbi:MAG: nucleotide-binding protein [Magnetococcus sp. DMHC-6]
MCRIFVGTTAEKKDIARNIQLYMHENSPDVKAIPWMDIMQSGNTALGCLMHEKETFDFACFIIGDDDIKISRGTKTSATRDNILLEIGIFYGHLGPNRVFLLHEREKKPFLPSNLDGIILISYDDSMPHDLQISLQPACTKILNNIKQIIKTRPSPIPIWLINFKEFYLKETDNSPVIDEIIKKISQYKTDENPYPIHICGPAAIGKSTFASQLKKQIGKTLNCKADILPTDCYSLSRNEKEALQLQGYEPESHNLQKLVKDYTTLMKRKSVKLKLYHHTHNRTNDEIKVNGEQFLIIEGVYSFYPGIIHKSRGVYIYLYAVPNKAKELIFMTNIMKRAYTVEKALEKLEKNFKSYQENIENNFLNHCTMQIHVDNSWHYYFPNNLE